MGSVSMHASLSYLTGPWGSIEMALSALCNEAGTLYCICRDIAVQ